MERRFVLIQGAVPVIVTDYPVKILFERYDGISDGFYVGGWTTAPVFVAPFSDSTYSQILLYGITATGPEPNDWVVGGWGVSGTGRTYLFYDSTGLIAEVPITPPWTGGFVFTAAGGNFSVSLSGRLAEPSIYYTFATPNFSDNALRLSGDQGIGFVGNQTLSEGRLDMVVGTLRKQIVINLDYTYSVFVGNNPWDATSYPSGNPWLVNNSNSTFVRLTTDINTAIPKSDLYGLTLYQRDVDFIGRADWPNEGEHSLNITPQILSTSGTVTEGTGFNVKYLAPSPNDYFAWDASVWLEVSPGLFSLWQGPDGYYVVNGAGVPTLAAPYFDDFSPGGIFQAGFTVTGTNDWRFGALGGDSSFQIRNGLFYGPGGLAASFTTAALGIQASGTLGSGVLLGAVDQRDGIRQRYWHTQTASGNGPNTFPNIPPLFILPGQTFTVSSSGAYQNADLSWAVRSGELLKADGTIIPITSGEPSPWPNISLNSQSACFVGLTLFVFSWPPTAPSVTFTPYRYDPDAGTATQEDPIVMPYAGPGSGYILRYLSYWTPTP